MTELIVDGVRVATLAMAAEFLGVSRMTVFTLRKEGKLTEYRLLPRRVCFKWSDLEALKAERQAHKKEIVR